MLVTQDTKPNAIKGSISRLDYPKMSNLYSKGIIKNQKDLLFINIHTVLYIQEVLHNSS